MHVQPLDLNLRHEIQETSGQHSSMPKCSGKEPQVKPGLDCKQGRSETPGDSSQEYSDYMSGEGSKCTGILS